MMKGILHSLGYRSIDSAHHGEQALQRCQHQRCQALCEEALSTNKYLVEAYDLQSENLMRSGDAEQARLLLKKTLEISPYQLQRLQQFFQLSLRTGRQDEMLVAAQHMYELTCSAGSKDPKQLLNYVRCLLNAVSASTESSQKKRLQQESLLIMHRARRDEHLLRKIKYECFERLYMARLDAADVRHLQARRSCQELVQQLGEEDTLCCDLAMLCNQIGEFDLAAQLKPSARLDAAPIALSLWQQQQQQVEPQRLAFSQFSRQGLSCYEQGDYAGATKHYEQALHWAPHNSSTQLNLLQSVLQSTSHDMPVANITPVEIIRRIQLQPLVGAQKERLQMLQRQLADLTANGKLAG